MLALHCHGSLNLRCFFRLELPDQHSDEHSVVAGAAELFQLRKGILRRLGGSERALSGHVDEGVG